MTDLDWLPPADSTIVVPTPRKCRHIRTWRTFQPLPPEEQVPGMPLRGNSVCGSCGKIMDPDKARRGKSSRRLGGDQERRIERVYGPVKIGERGDPVDHLGRVWRWQSKATRQLPPRWIVAIEAPSWLPRLPLGLAGPHVLMDGLYSPRVGVVIRSFVSNGTRTRDWMVIRATDGDELGLERRLAGWYVMSGDWWLDHFGRDE